MESRLPTCLPTRWLPHSTMPIPTISPVAPDLGHLPAEPVVAPPKWAYAIPALFYLIVAGFIWEFSHQQRAFADLQSSDHTTEEQRSKIATASSALQQQALLFETRNRIATAIENWQKYSPALQPVVVAVLQAVQGQAKINSFSIDRMDGETTSYQLTISFADDNSHCGAAGVAIRKSIEQLHWRFTEGDTKPQGNCILYSAIISPP